MSDDLYEKINKLTDDEISKKVKGGHYNDDANSIAVAILKQRGLNVPPLEEGCIEPKIPFYKSHPIWFWTFVGAGFTILRHAIEKFYH